MDVMFSFDSALLNYFRFTETIVKVRRIIFCVCFYSGSGCEQNRWFIERGARGCSKSNIASNILLEIFKGKASCK